MHTNIIPTYYVSRKISNILTVSSKRQHPIETFSYVQKISGLNLDKKKSPKNSWEHEYGRKLFRQSGRSKEGPIKTYIIYQRYKKGNDQNWQDFTRNHAIYSRGQRNVTISKQSKLAGSRQLQISQTR